MDLSDLQSARKRIGVKQTIKALADRQVTADVVALCLVKDIELIEIPTRAELGNACGIDVGAAVVALLK